MDAETRIMSFAMARIKYEHHPAYADEHFNTDVRASELARQADAAVTLLQRQSMLPSTDVKTEFERFVVPALDALFEHLKAAYRDDYRQIFFGQLSDKVSLLLKEDFRIAGSRGTHCYSKKSDRADALFDELLGAGFFLGRFADGESFKALGKAMAPYQATLMARYKDEGRTDRTSLSFNEWPRDVHEIMRSVFEEPDIVAALSNYMGMRIRFGGAAFELSVPEARWWRSRYGIEEESMEAAYFHLDQSSIYPKMLCYLSEVGPGNGPTSILPFDLEDSAFVSAFARAMDSQFDLGEGRINPNHLLKLDWGRRCLAALPKELCCVAHFGNDCMVGSEEERLIRESQVKMIGPPGQYIVFDGARMAHRGGNVTEGHRWAFQVIYGPAA